MCYYQPSDISYFLPTSVGLYIHTHTHICVSCGEIYGLHKVYAWCTCDVARGSLVRSTSRHWLRYKCVVLTELCVHVLCEENVTCCVSRLYFSHLSN